MNIVNNIMSIVNSVDKTAFYCINGNCISVYSEPEKSKIKCKNKLMKIYNCLKDNNFDVRYHGINISDEGHQFYLSNIVGVS